MQIVSLGDNVQKFQSKEIYNWYNSSAEFAYKYQQN